MRRFVPAAALSAALALPTAGLAALVGPVPGAAASPSPAGSGGIAYRYDTGAEADFRTRVNAERANAGVAALTLRDDLTEVARRHAARLADEQALYHNPNLGSEVTGWREVGEVVGRGGDVDVVHQAFMASDSHRREILHGGYTEIGTGVAWSVDGQLYVSQVFRTPDGTGQSAGNEPEPAPAPQPPPQPAPRPQPATSAASTSTAAAAPTTSTSSTAPTTTTTTTAAPPITGSLDAAARERIALDVRPDRSAEGTGRTLAASKAATVRPVNVADPGSVAGLVGLAAIAALVGSSALLVRVVTGRTPRWLAGR